MKPLRFSRLKNAAQSLAHYRHGLDAEYDSPSLRLGRLVHHKIMGATPDTSKPVVIFEGGARKGKAWEKFRADHDGFDIFLASENEKANAMSRALCDNELAYDLIGAHRGANREMTLRWEFCGRECQGTPDLFAADLLVDVKTAQTTDPDRWLGRYGVIHRFSYHAQLAWYSDAIEACGFPRPDRVSIVAVESKAPFVVTVFDLDESELDDGRRLYRSWLERVLVAEASGVFPGYSHSPVRVVAHEDDQPTNLIFGDEEEESEAA